ncbi:MAG: ATP-binding protein [Aquificae bacterium]|nr:ATP-binding protein [Aquificota bacterium]
MTLNFSETQDKPKCKQCKDIGWIYTKKGVVKCECKLGKLDQNIYTRMRIPPRYRHVSLDKFQILKKHKHHILIKQIKDYILYPKEFKLGKGLFLVGNPGVGKTHLAISILKELYKTRGIVGLFYDTNNLLFDLRATFDGKTSTRELLNEVISTPILVLDDLGAERLSDWAKDILHYIITTRYNQLKPVIITSNIHIDQPTEKSNQPQNLDISLKDRLGNSIASRLEEMCKILEVQGEDMRKTTIVKKMLEDTIEESND